MEAVVARMKQAANRGATAAGLPPDLANPKDTIPTYLRDLTPIEVQHFDIWLEDHWGAEVADVFAKPLRTVTLAPPSLRAPLKAEGPKADPPAPEPEDEAGSFTHNPNAISNQLHLPRQRPAAGFSRDA